MSNNIWSMEDKLRAAFAYIITGNAVDASKLCNIPDRTIRGWTETTWWSDLVAEAKNSKNQELDAIYTDIIHIATAEVKDRVVNGDTVVTKEGESVRKPMNGKDIAMIAAIFQDKRAILRGEPTRISKTINEKERLKSLASNLEEIDTEEQGINLH